MLQFKVNVMAFDTVWLLQSLLWLPVPARSFQARGVGERHVHHGVPEQHSVHAGGDMSRAYVEIPTHAAGCAHGTHVHLLPSSTLPATWCCLFFVHGDCQ
jgi:hypothetical protein